MNDIVFINDSPIDGLGLFSKTFIKKNQKITDYYGEIMNWKDFKIKYGDYKTNCLNTYPMRRIWKIIVAKEEPYKTKNLVNYINENENPNVFLKKKALYALRDIEPFEELTLSYPRDYKREYKLRK